MYRFLFILGFLFLSNVLPAQHYLESNYYANNYSISGLSLHYCKPILSFQKEKEKKNKIIDKQLFVGLQLTLYNRVNNHRAYIASPYIRYQKTFNSGIFVQQQLGLGYMYKQNIIPTYIYENGQVSELKHAGHSRFLPSLNLGLGYNLDKKTNIPVQIHFRTGLSFEFPNNIDLLFHFQSEIGVAYIFKTKKDDL